MTAAWEEEHWSYRRRDLSEKDHVYVWADGVHFRVRLEEDRLCTLVLLGVHYDGTKELIAVEDGYRESAESWSSVLPGLKRRALRAPVLKAGDCALGLWRTVRDVWPETQGAAMLGASAEKRARQAGEAAALQEKVKRAQHEIMCADRREDAEAEIERFAEDYRAKHPKAVESLTRNQDCLLSFFDFPAEHWQHSDHQRNGIDLRHRAAASAGHQGCRLTDQGPAHGHKAARHGAETLATSHRAGRRRSVREGVPFNDGTQVRYAA